MPDHGSVTQWIHLLKQGDAAAAQKLWERYYGRLVALAQKKLRATPQRAADAEDAALHAFDAFLRAAEKGRFPRLDDRDDLWHILGAITARKAADQVVLEGRAKRGGGQVRGDSVLEGPTATDSAEGWERIRGTDPTPESAAETAEELQRLLALLPDEEARSIAVGKMQGYTNEEIAGQLGRSIPTIERRLRIIRKAWEKEVNPEGSGDALSPP